MTTAADQWVNRIEVPSESSSRLYIVAQRAPGGPNEPWHCSCPIFKSRRQIVDGRVSCKHLREMGKVGPVVNANMLSNSKPKPKRTDSRSFSDDAYRHYDTSNGYGSPEAWRRAAEEAAFGSGYRSWTWAEKEAERQRAEAEREQKRREREARARAERERQHRQRTYTPPPPRYGSSLAADLALLDLDELPVTARDLKAAMRLAAFKTHPDHGGTDAAFKAMFAAYERLLGRYPK